MRRRPRPIWRRRAAWAAPCDGGAARRFSAKTQRVRAIRRGQSPPSTRPFSACGKRRERKEMGRCPTPRQGEAPPAPAAHPADVPRGDPDGAQEIQEIHEIQEWRARARPQSAPICRICGFPASPVGRNQASKPPNFQASNKKSPRREPGAFRGAVGARVLLDLDLGAGLLEGLLDLGGLVLVDALLDGLGGAFDEVLGILAARMTSNSVFSSAAGAAAPAAATATGAAAETPHFSSRALTSSAIWSTVMPERASMISSWVIVLFLFV